ncbi:MAG: restriction endonuclease subunit S [Victivallaceae bacterium]|nr:restriction endonuclease subunit S [Victivallaceae bacterium]
MIKNKCILGDIGRIVTGKTPSTKNKTFWDGEIPFVSPVDLQNGKHILKTERTITETGKGSVKCCTLPPGAVCVSCIGNLGYTALTTHESVSNQQINTIIPSANYDTDFVYYLLKSLWPEFKNMEGQSTTLSILNKTQFSKIQVSVPELSIQKKIGAFLSSLDDKIELNIQINQNLEEQAKAIFKSWFVDFEPFQDGKFMDSELGPIPEGWQVGTLEEIIELHDSRRVPLSGSQREKMKKIYPYYGAASLMDYVEDYLFDGAYTLLGEDGTVVTDDGMPILQYVWGKFWVNNHAHILTGKKGHSPETLYILLKNTPIKSIVTGAVQPKISQANLKSIPIVIAPKEQILKYKELIDPLFAKVRENHDESNHLATLRDTLLPKLMSGEIDVSEVEV